MLREAAKHGLYLTVDNRLLDVADGAGLDGAELVEPLSETDISRLRRYTTAEMSERVVTDSSRAWRPDALLCTLMEGGAVELSAVIGFGFTERRDHLPALTSPHGFSVTSLRACAGQGMLRHRHNRTQVLIARSGRWEVALNKDADVVAVLGPEDTLSIPAGAWRSFVNRSDELGELLVVTGGDERVRLQWDEGVVSEAEQGGVARDPYGYMASADMLPRNALSRSRSQDF